MSTLLNEPSLSPHDVDETAIEPTTTTPMTSHTTTTNNNNLKQQQQHPHRRVLPPQQQQQSQHQRRNTNTDITSIFFPNYSISNVFTTTNSNDTTRNTATTTTTKSRHQQHQHDHGGVVTSESHHSTALSYIPNDADDDDDDDNEYPTLLRLPTTTTTRTSVVTAIAPGAILNLCNATLGAGILALPFTFLQAGIIPCLGLLIMAAVATERSIYILITVLHYCRNENHDPNTTATTQYNSYESLVEHVLDQAISSSSSSSSTTTTTRRECTISYRRTIEIAMLLFCCGCAIGYIMAIMDILEQFHLLFVYQSRTYTILVVWGIAMVPLSLLPNVQSLQYASAIGIMAIAILIVAALVHYLQHQNHNHSYYYNHYQEPQSDFRTTSDTSTASILLKLLSNWRKPFGTTSSNNNNTDDENVSITDFLWPINGWLSILTSGPVVLFAFSCQPNVCSIYDELMVNDDDDDNHHRTTDHGEILEMNHIVNNSKKVRLMQRVTIIAVCICSTLYCSISVIALADFGNNVQPNMLSCYSGGDSRSSTLIQIATAAMALAIVMAFPLNIFPARVTLIGLWDNYCRPRQLLNPESIISNHIDHSISLHRIVPHGGLTAALLDGEEIDEHVLPTTILDNGHNDRSLVSSLNGLPYETNDNPSATSFASSDPPFNKKVHTISTLILTSATLILALILPNISVVFGLLGGTASSWLGFCVPGLLGIQLSKNECASGQPPRYGLLLTSWALLVGGIVVGVLTTAVTIYNTLVHK